MNADLMQRWAALTKALEGDTATLQSLRKAQMLLVAGCWVMVLAAVALKLTGALTQIVFMLGVLGACCGGGSLLVGRKLATVRRRAESRRDEMQHMIEVVQRQEQPVLVAAHAQQFCPHPGAFLKIEGLLRLLASKG